MLWDGPKRGEDNLPPYYINLARKATELRPEIAKNWETLGVCLLKSGENEKAIAVLSEAVSRLPQEPKLHLMLAQAYCRAGRLDTAHEILKGAPTIRSDDRAMSLLRFELLLEVRSGSDARQVASDILALDPTNFEALDIIGKAARNDGRPEIMVPLCRAALALQPGHTFARYQLAFALTMLGRFGEAQQLIDLDHYITVTKLATPDDYPNAEAFEAALANEIALDPTLKPDPIGKATRGGLQTGRLPQDEKGAVGALLGQIRRAVDAFEANLEGGLEHPFVARRPKRGSLDAWAIIYPGEGRQVSHIHRAGWLSGVYYVSLPKTPCLDQRGGCLVLGTLELKDHSLESPWGIRDIHPVPGSLVMFPSYIPHSTVPTKSTETRICIAFDVVPDWLDKPSIGRSSS
jgi:uncharacterized protein (TIGR02466 family)